MPVAVGVVLILGAGGAWVALNGKRNTNGSGLDTPPVSRDTAAGLRTPQTGDTGRRLAARPPAPPAAQSRPVRSGVSPARASDSLNTLLDRIDDLSGTMLRDAALDIFNTEGVSNKDKALAAYLAATGWARLSDTSNMCAWARRAVNLDRATPAYGALQQQACGS
jgi:hypothetical protein